MRPMDEVLYPSDFQPVPRRSKARGPSAESRRDPYDGLRPWSAVTHGAGVLLSAVGTALLILGAVWKDAGAWHIVSFAIYGLSMICLYTASTLYHCLNTGVAGRVALRKYDHASIYFLIAGTYTPVCLTALRGPWGWSLFGVIWGLAVIGAVLTMFRINAPRWVTAGVYIFMGWLAVIAIYPIYLALGGPGLFWLLGGGVLYTIGGVLYALKWPGRDNPRFGCHEIFHLFILAGSLFHYLLMLLVVL